MRVGVIGTGKMGENHVRTYLSLKDDCQLVGIFDKDTDRNQQVAKKYQVTPYSSLDELLQNVDAVSIAVPTKFHYAIGLKCIEHETHMLMEKPLTSTIDEASDLIEKANQAGIKLQVGHIELFNPLIHLLKEKIEHENIIGMSFLRLNSYDERIKEVDVVKDLMIHDLYILQELVEDDFVELYAAGNSSNSTIKHAAVLIKSSQGVIAELVASFKSKKQLRIIQILTEETFIKADLLNNTITQSTGLATNKVTVPLTKTIQIDPIIQPLDTQLAAFIQCIKYNQEPIISGEDGKQALEITNKISKLIDKS